MAFPSTLDALPTTHADGDVNAGVHAALHNAECGAINAIETLIGVNSAGSFATLKAKMEKPEPIHFNKQGIISVLVGATPYLLPFDCTIVDVRAYVGTAPTGASIIIDANKNGTTIFTTQANRPTIAAAANASAVKIPDVTTAVAGDRLSVDIDQVGSTLAGSDLAVVFTVKRV